MQELNPLIIITFIINKTTHIFEQKYEGLFWGLASLNFELERVFLRYSG